MIYDMISVSQSGLWIREQIKSIFLSPLLALKETWEETKSHDNEVNTFIASVQDGRKK